MFWKFDLHSSSQIEKLLEKEDVTLQELLDEEDVLQECKAQNQRLLLFLTRDSSMLELLNLITHEPPADREEKLRYKYANVACELLTCDVSLINDKFGGDEALLNTLYSFLEQKSALNPLLSSFFTKAFGNLISRKTEQVLGFLKNKEDFIGQVLKHLDTSAMMDLVLRLISCVDPVCLRQEVLTWLNDERLIQRLIELIHPHSDGEMQSNASQTLCDIIRLSRDQASLLQETSETDPLLTTLELQQNVEALLKNMFEGEKSEVCIVNGTQVLLALLETRRPGVEQVIDPCSQGLEKSYTVNNSILMGIQPHLKNFHHLLLNPPKKCVMLTTMGVLEEPFGNTRLHASRLMAALLYTRAPRIHLELCQLNMINLLLDLFFKFSWNNFLHIQVEHCVSAILNQTTPNGKTQDSPDQIQLETQDTQNSDKSDMFTCCDMIKHLLKDCRLVQRILDAWEENDKTQEAGGMRKGYMGHLTRIANTVVQNAEREQEQTQIAQLIKELPEDYKARWEQFVNETLTETNKRNTADLVRSLTETIVGSIFTICKSPLISIFLLTQVFTDYQIQQMTANFVDQFGLNDDEFGDHDGRISTTFDRITEIKFNLVDEGASSAVFETCTKERIRSFDDAEEEEDIWEDKEINYVTKGKSRSRFGLVTNAQKSEADGGSRRRLGSPDMEWFPETKQTQENTKNQEMDKQSSDPQSPGWIASFEDDFSCRDFTSIAIDTGSSVWGSSTAQLSETEEKGWATFTDFQPFCCSDAGPRCSSPVDSENPNKTSQNEEIKGSSACVWSVCGARKAPLVASDSSSSESESEEEEDRTNIITESVPTANAKDNVKLSVDAKNEKAVFISESNPRATGSITDPQSPKEQKGDPSSNCPM
ncbi:serine/threonine-protein phosphatase 6 regulatory subunit 2 isoform X1 [Carassius auratus]|uniref:Serine/threonine-protein phosphatase 6 regulatory subunit 2-like isoform X1 n=1 Tax=Carassius auratus TaxID=7957 RepID=A0A6P6RCA7_CARAU|nr:serine/threonine-protein phosphatase 6 regulatory subunit 2-like isoform X1 [Carassius auratus]XP_026142876.1 serine/threonine-protein phosphatase 6 regulatory subunit 2-like isoform X1 [Carassius auratus]XP_026142877.1 serine/threonine-protein phosphatase 6 regulatory subunit 2-like isoform X1 [Carassius auratus]